MNEYERITRQTRRNVSRLTLQQQRDILRLYDEAIKSLSEQVKKENKRKLTKRWLMDYQKEIERTRAALARELNKSIRGYTTKAAQEAVTGQKRIMTLMFEKAALDVGDHFSTAFSVVQRNVIADIVSGGLYKDNKTLSTRIWQATGQNGRDIESIITQGIVEKKSAIKLSEDLEQFVKPPSQRPADWAKVYPIFRTKVIDYNAMRLARTSINHAYQNATIQSSQMNPFVEGIEWQSALIHGRTCQICMERDGEVYPVKSVPLDHP